MTEPIPIDAARLFEFVGRPGLTVVFVSAHPRHGFNRALCDHLRDEHGEEIVFGTVDFRDLFLSAGPALPFLYESLRASGAPSTFGVLPGYWLFREGQVLAWDPGLPSMADAKTIAQSALLGAIWWAATREWAFVGDALRIATDEMAARRIAAAFREAAAHRADPRSSGRPSPAPSFDELLRAYQALGVSPTATEEEVKQAWRRRQMETHPDRAAHDPAEFERRSRLAAEINRARDVIFAERRRAGAQATA